MFIRLKLLVASQQAGNSSSVGEIFNILGELRERGIITN